MKNFWSNFISVLITLAIVGCAGYFLVYKKNIDDKNFLQQQIDALKKKDVIAMQPKEVVADPTADWQNYENANYSISFKYPKEWPSPVVTTNNKSRYEPWDASNTEIYFNESDKAATIKSIYFSRISSYADSEVIDELKNVYVKKKVDDLNQPFLLKRAGGISYANSPKYIATADEKYRGYYYFANINVLDRGTGVDCVIVMTDNQNIIQFQFSRDSDRASNYRDEKGDVLDTFGGYIQGLDEKSDEQVIKEFNLTYKYIAQSLSSAQIAATSTKILSLEQLKAGQYSIADIKGMFNLKNGSYSYKCTGGPTCTVTLDEDNIANGDLNNDKIEETAVVLDYNAGGTGTTKYLAVAKNNSGKFQFISSKILAKGNVESITIANSTITVKMKTYAAKDPELSPSIDKTYKFKLTNNALTEVK